MSAMDFKKHTDLNFPHYAPPAVSVKEIDLLGLLDVLLAAKKTHHHHCLCICTGRPGNRLSDTAKMDQ
ncbi:Ferric enterobactin uptake protein FepE [Enterobacter hormaechei]|nr:Ferric enterobactin uptake protein FepE [Enterobacter hormaechei]